MVIVPLANDMDPPVPVKAPPAVIDKEPLIVPEAACTVFVEVRLLAALNV